MFTSAREDLLFLPPILASLSLVYVGAKVLFAFVLSRPLANDVKDNGLNSENGVSSSGTVKARRLAESIQELDGWNIVLFRMTRLFSVLALLSLQIFKLNISGGSLVQYLELLLYIYTSALSISSIVLSPRWRDVASRQLALIVFAEFLVYFVLDAWPYATITPYPYDSASDPATWTRVCLLALSGVIVPLIMPRPFRPLIPGAVPGANEVCSILSRATYTFLDGIVWYAYRVPDVTANDLPHVPERQKIETLSEHSFKAIDPIILGRKRHILWGYFSVWGRDYLWCLLWMTLHAVCGFVGVIGTQNLLGYLETGELAYGLQPWVWIILLALGPVVSACLFTQFLYVGTKIEVESSSVFTYIVFSHSLRIRMKDDMLVTDEEKKSKEALNANTPAAVDVNTEVEEEQAGVDLRPDESTPEGGHAKEKSRHLIGKINNLLTTDLMTIDNTHFIVTVPAATIQLIISVMWLYRLLGWSSFVGLAIMVVLSPVPAYLGKAMLSVQRKKLEKMDKRVQAVTENINILRMIKLFAWEPFVLKKLSARRTDELSKLRNQRLLDAALDNVNSMLPLLSKLVTFGVYTVVQKGNLTPSRIFAALMLFSMTEEQIKNVMFTIPDNLKAKVSYDRYTEFLNSTELLESKDRITSNCDDNSTVEVSTNCPKDIIGFHECTFSWDAFENKGGATPGKHLRKQFHLRFDGEVTFKRGEINLIFGPTASGKTSVLMALLGEMYYKPHGFTSWYNLPREGKIAYHPQESWVLNATIKDNILFGEPLDEDRYKKVLKQCALEHDLSLWEARDLTEVGEKGLTLSGGQKARVTLARALYSPASILLLDDVLAALDVHTAKWIVEKVLRGELVHGRTVILVTHNIALTAPIAGHSILLGRHGNVVAQGPVAEVLRKDARLSAQVEKDRKEVEKDIENKLGDGKEGEEDVSVKQAAGKLVVAEEKSMGRVEWAAFMLYIISIGGPAIWVALIGTMCFAQIFSIGQTYFIGYWSSQYEKHPVSEIPVLTYLGLYALINIFSKITDASSQVFWLFRTMRASAAMHYRLLGSIFSATFRWLDVTPIGRIITRCTQDIGTVDNELAIFLGNFMRLTVSLLALFIGSVIMAGWYAFIPGLVLAVLGGFLGYVYLKCQICIRREMSNAKSPVMSQVAAALSGLPSIRAYGAQEMFHKELQKRINMYTLTSLSFYNINRWVSIRIDSLGGIFAGVVSAYLVYGSRVSAGEAGFTISIVLGFSRIILYWVRLYNLLEIQANSLERILEFLRIDHEPKATESGKPPAHWPSSGSLRVERLSARYSDDTPDVLQGVSFDIASGERVAIVGRTGAGKSSIALALLRAIKTSGKVYYDGLATDEINLDALRSNITLIPQQPELLHGTLRENLDPLGQHDDATLTDALQTAGLNARDAGPAEHLGASGQQDGQELEAGSAENPGMAKDDSKVGLDTMVENGGVNFSLGQRQIIALARAMIRRSKLLIMDEATAAIDYETDIAIQKALRTEFSKDTTFITIAHRLQTIIDYDKIIVLDSGQLIEYGTPKNLLKMPKGLLRALVDDSGDREKLYRLAGVEP